MIIKIKTDTYSVITKILVLLFILECNLFNLINLHPYFDSLMDRYYICVIGIILFVWFLLNTRLYKEIKQYMKFINIYILLTFIVLVIQFYYSMNKYDETILDVILVGFPFLLVLLAYPILYIFDYDKSFEKLMKKFCIVSYIGICLILIQSIMYKYYSIWFLKAISISFKSGRVRISDFSLFSLSILYIFYLYLVSNKKRYLLLTGIGMLGVGLVVSSRMLTIVLSVCLLIMFLLKRRPLNNKLCIVIILIVVILICYQLGFFESIISSFSTSGKRAGSTLARIDAINYFKTYTDENMFLGMGFVRPYRPDLVRIWSGPNRTAFFDDLGALGLFFRMGLTSIIVYGLILFRMAFVLLKIKKYKSNEFILCCGIFAFLIGTSITLVVTDYQRAFAIPFIIAIYEFVYRKSIYNIQS